MIRLSVLDTHGDAYNKLILPFKECEEPFTYLDVPGLNPDHVPMLPFFSSKTPGLREKPFRAQVLSREALAQRAGELAERTQLTTRRIPGARLRPRFRGNYRILENAYFAFAESAREKEMLSAGAEWILDNYHVIDEQVRDIRRDLPRNYYKSLPKLSDDAWYGFPRVYWLACEYITHTDSIVETELLSVFIEAYQAGAAPTSVLKIGEIWAVPIMLRLALIENLRRLAVANLIAREDRRVAEGFCKKVIDSAGSVGSDILANLVYEANQNLEIIDRGAAHIMRRLRAKGTPAALASQWLDQKLREKGLDPAEIMRLEQHGQAADQISVGNAVTALKTIGSLNWREWFERVSRVDQILNRDPAQTYRSSDFTTRDTYRHHIERLAERNRRTELHIAEELVRFADSHGDRITPRPPEGADQRECHIGYYLVDDGLPRFEEHINYRPSVRELIKRWCAKQSFTLYTGAILGITLLGALCALVYAFRNAPHEWWPLLFVLLFIVPLSECATQVVQWFVTKIVTPLPLPKLDFEKGVPDEFRTVVVVHTICTDREAIDRTIEGLEIRFIGNDDKNVLFAVLADLRDAPAEVMPGDRGLISHAAQRITELNERYCSETPHKFFLLFRKRSWNPSEELFLGWERKRGKLMEFNRLLRGAEDTSFSVIVGSLEVLKSCRFAITLDNDTQLPPGVGHRLIGSLAHPLNRPILEESTNIVVKGYSIVQPRVGITLQSALGSPFARIFSGHSGLDPYTTTVSDVYQDLFGEGSYIGKGIYDLDAFEASLKNRVPENALLSHDLFEGLFARVGLASDIELFDEFPIRYHAYARRQHRWIRGDWQLIRWVGSPLAPTGALSSNESSEEQAPTATRSRVPTLGRWKLIDNLRRSLVALCLFFLLLTIWMFAHTSQIVCLLFLLGLLMFPLMAVLIGAIIDFPIGYSVTSYLQGIGRDVKKHVQQILLHLVLLPHQTCLSLHAIGITLYRVFMSRKHLLEWETAYATEKRLTPGLLSFIREMRSALVLTATTHVILTVADDTSAVLTLPFFLAWYASPIVAWRASLARAPKLKKISSAEESYLRKVAFHTWKYFDTFLTPEYNFLIPDNLQVVPKRIVAERTSPTNISLSVLSVLSAYDLGFIPLPGALERISNILHTLEGLERFHGHFLNWYEIRQTRALTPRYVSTVDSGNLVGHFIAAREMLLKLPHSPLMGSRHLSALQELLYSEEGIRGNPELNGIKPAGSRPSAPEDGLEMLYETLHRLEVVKHTLASRSPNSPLIRTITEFGSLSSTLHWVKYLPLLERLAGEQSAHKRLKNIGRILSTRAPTLSLLLKLTRRLTQVHTLVDSSKLTEHEQAQLSEFNIAVTQAHEELRAMGACLSSLLTRFTNIINDVDFHFLFDERKKLFVIGYNIDIGHRDNSYYDLLASEARLASLVAIAKGDVDQTHWFVLNRGLTDSLGGKALLSWSGTMFEYLMPLLVTKDFPGTLLSETYRAVIKAQRQYAKRRGIPWGISESAYSGVDFEKTYQYRAFGIPGLGLKRGLAENLVVSPYSTCLAIPIDPLAALKNLTHLERIGMWGEFGFYEAVDFTPERLSAEEDQHIVRSFLAHHQGMSLTSINNFLNRDIFQESFHANPMIRACELLLQERFPTRIPIIVPHQAELSFLEKPEAVMRAERSERLLTPHTRVPVSRVLSNGHYSLLLDNAGSGGSFLDSSTALTRWREDGLRNNSGTYIYVNERGAGQLWSVTYQPTCIEPDEYEVHFNPDKIEYRRKDFGLSIHTEITVSPEDNVEVRRVSLSNLSSKTREVELTSFGEVALAPRQADLAHPAFSKMFVESEFLEDYDALLFVRRPRSPKDMRLFFVHLVTMPVVWAPVQFQTSRELFLGRGGSVVNPLGLQSMRTPSSFVRAHRIGTVLDPIFSLTSKIELEPASSQSLSFVSGVAHSREDALRLVSKYREGQNVSRAFELAWSQSDVEMRHQQFTIAQAHAFQRLGNALVYNMPLLRAPSDTIKRNRLPQSALWRLGISGDEPIVLVTLTDPQQVGLAQELLIAHEYLRLRGIRLDLVLINEYPGGYLQNFQEELDLLIRSGYSREHVDKQGGVFLRVASQITEDELTLLYAVARVILHGTKGTLSEQIQIETVSLLVSPRTAAASRSSELPEKSRSFEPQPELLEFSNAIGGFSEEGKSYSMVVSDTQLPPQPWSNIVANEHFGFLVTESGAGYTWADNSRENRLSSWSNDPVCDPFSEVLYVRDSENGSFWAPTPRPVAHGEKVKVTHGFGYTRFSTQVEQIASILTLSGSTHERVKWWHLELTNNDVRERKLELFLYFDPVLGVLREDSFRHQQFAFDEQSQMLYLHNPFNIDFSSQLVFFGCSLELDSYTCDRREFVGRHRDVSAPLALMRSALTPSLGQFLSGQRATPVRLARNTSSGLDHCVVLKANVTLAPSEKREVQFFVAQTNSLPTARTLSAQYRSLRARHTAFAEVTKFWDEVTGAVQIHTPNKAFDMLVNGWLLYQTLACRMLARTGFYQSSGALGFRDQLQDCMALLVCKPELSRKQILLHASRQFQEGDVQHWWHPPSGKGIRTKISDNYLWLPYVVYEYLRVTGDSSILEQKVKFIEGPPLEPEEMESYNTPRVSELEATLYDHCLIALDRALVFGSHGIPFMGAGDWNDGLNQVGVQGKGESVWLGWFLADILTKFSELVEGRRDMYRANEYRVKAQQLVSSIEEQCWDGAWYHRAYFDNGVPIGSSRNVECQIDSIAQSWSVISDLGRPDRRKLAMQNVYDRLVFKQDRIICLLWPPFDKSDPNPGYIRGYPPGLRENGGQYTHAATWVVMATALMGDGARAFELFDILNPILHTTTPEDMARYQTEPYVTCGDVYSVPPHTGRGGWSWYTGSSGWLYRIALEYMVGLQVRSDHFVLNPCIPADWKEFEIDFTLHSEKTQFHIKVENPRGVSCGVSKLAVNWHEVPDKKVQLRSPEYKTQIVQVVATMG